MASHTVDIGQDLKQQIRKFRLKKVSGSSALVVKIDKKSLTMAVDEELQGTIEEMAEELPENSPRYVILSHPLTHKDGRLSYPLVLINWAPSSSSTDMMTLHASGLSYFQQTAELSKVIEVREGAEQLTEKFVNEKLLA